MLIGQTKLGYQIVEQVGQGGFGTVYRAIKRNKALETVRALKHISLPSRKQWTDVYNSMGNDVAKTDEYFDAILQEILNEIRILADLTNKGVKNVVWYYENEIEDTPSPKHYDIYLLMEFLTSLPAYIETHEIKVKDVIKIGQDILSALIECHKRNIIHRDIKTDNIFVSEDGDYKLGDFGVSKKLSDRSRATSMKGTPNYIAPEVYLGQEYDETVDLYSLGIVLYRLFNYNRNPFMPNYPDSYNSEDEDKAFELRMAGNVPPYPQFVEGALGDVILKAIADKENRFRSAAEFKAALTEAANALTKDELETVVLENVMGSVDFSTFGSNNNLTQMSDNRYTNQSQNNQFMQPNMQSNMQQSMNQSQFSMNQQNSFAGNMQPKKKSPVGAIMLLLVLIAGIGAGAYFMINQGQKSGKFVQENGVTKFLKVSGEYAQNEWVFYNNEEYYFNGRQSLVTNTSVDFDGKTYYVNKDGAKIIDNWYTSPSGDEYYLDSNGIPFKDTAKTINNEVAFFGADGKRTKNGWVFYDNSYYYLEDKVVVRDAFRLVNGFWYFLGGDGKMLGNTFYDVEGVTYYFGPDGAMKSDTLFQVGSDFYYALASGEVKKGGWVANNQYYAGTDGKLLINTTTPDGVKVDGTGKRVQETQAYIPPVTQTYNASYNNNSWGGGSSNFSSSPTITPPNVAWGEHLRYRETVYLDEYGEDGVGKISIDVTKLRDDGSPEVASVNATLQTVFEDACERAEYELPFKTYELDKTSAAVCTDTQLIIVVTGNIKHTDNSNEKPRYKITLDRTTGSATYEKVK